jgi:hypothetical protein
MFVNFESGALEKRIKSEIGEGPPVSLTHRLNVRRCLATALATRGHATAPPSTNLHCPRSQTAASAPGFPAACLSTSAHGIVPPAFTSPLSTAEPKRSSFPLLLLFLSLPPRSHPLLRSVCCCRSRRAVPHHASSLCVGRGSSLMNHRPQHRARHL